MSGPDLASFQAGFLAGRAHTDRAGTPFTSDIAAAFTQWRDDRECDHCEGTGDFLADDDGDCPVCRGSGLAPAPAVPVEPAATPRLVLDEKPWAGGTYALRVAGVPDGDPDGYLVAWISSADEPKVRAALAAHSPATVPGTSHVVKLVQVGGRVEVLIDGKLVIGTPQARDQRDTQTTLTTFRCVASSAALSPAEPEGPRPEWMAAYVEFAWMIDDLPLRPWRDGDEPTIGLTKYDPKLIRREVGPWLLSDDPRFAPTVKAAAPGSTGTGGAATGEHAHDFLPVRGHPDDDECTFRVDGTDDTYCGLTEAEHPAPTPPVVPAEDEQP